MFTDARPLLQVVIRDRQVATTRPSSELRSNNEKRKQFNEMRKPECINLQKYRSLRLRLQIEGTEGPFDC